MLKNLLAHIPSECPVHPVVDSAIPLAMACTAHLDAVSEGYETANVALAADHADIQPMLLSIAADAGLDLIVMGGYGHSRLQERILGGVTRGMLQSMTVPTLMSH